MYIYECLKSRTKDLFLDTRFLFVFVCGRLRPESKTYDSAGQRQEEERESRLQPVSPLALPRAKRERKEGEGREGKRKRKGRGEREGRMAPIYIPPSSGGSLVHLTDP